MGFSTSIRLYLFFHILKNILNVNSQTSKLEYLLKHNVFKITLQKKNTLNLRQVTITKISMPLCARMNPRDALAP